MSGWTEIVIRGYPGAELTAAFSGFDVIPGHDGLTSLVGRVADQPALIAVLTSLDDIHVPVVAVRTIDEEDRGRISSSAGDAPEHPAD
jgi:hypothetical protein